MNQHLFRPIALGPLTLKHRVVMAPLTRSRAGQPGDVPTAMNAEYYRQCAGAAFIVTDASAAFVFADLAPGARYRVDLLSEPTVVTGSRLPTRSIVGMSSAFTCMAGSTARTDVRAQVY